jgi:lysyl-tRNA synthetase, class II
MQLSEQEIVRREKLDKIRELGIDPYPAPLYPVDTKSTDVKENYEEGKEVCVAGRIMSIRIMGKASFAVIQDSEGKIQLYISTR